MAFTIVDLGKLARPATVFIQKVSNAVGILYEPTRITRKAQAEGAADKIKALARIEVTDLEQRALERFVHQEARKQENIESITAQAATALPATAKVEGLSEDWLAHFFKQCDTVSDKEMQTLWARVLAGEATNPGTFSRRTIDFISTIDKHDAALFTIFCQFLWDLHPLRPVIYDTAHEIFTKQGVNFGVLKHLDAIGLISFESIAGYTTKGFPKTSTVHYYGQAVTIEFPADKDNVLGIGHALLTNVGMELAPLCGSVRNDAFYHYVIQKWSAMDLMLSSPLPERKQSTRSAS